MRREEVDYVGKRKEEGQEQEEGEWRSDNMTKKDMCGFLDLLRGKTAAKELML
jgi:hypothetical protein